MADCSTAAGPILNLSPGHHWARRQLHAGIRDVTFASILMKSLHRLRGGPGKAQRGCWQSQSSIADSSTPGWPIPALKARRCWSQRQLYAGIGYVSIAPVLIRLLVTLQGVIGRQNGVLAIPELDVRSLHNRSSDSRSEGRMPLDPAPATRRYKERHCHINTHEIAIYSAGGPGPAKRGCWRSQNSIADPSTTAWPIPDLKAQRRWARRQPHDGIRYFSCASVSMEFATHLRVVFCLYQS